MLSWVSYRDISETEQILQEHNPAVINSNLDFPIHFLA